MPFKIIRNDITKVKCDAIVNAANESLLGGGGVDGAIHRAAGPELLEECRTLGGCKTGMAKITGGYNMPCRYIIHTPGPVWQGGGNNEAELLYSCYSESMKLAAEYNCESIAFPLISSGIYGYPKAEALEIAVRAVKEFLEENEMEITLVVFDSSAVVLSEKVAGRISEYIDENYVSEASERDSRRFMNAEPESHIPESSASAKWGKPSAGLSAIRGVFSPLKNSKPFKKKTSGDFALNECAALFSEKCEDSFRVLDESFSQALLRIIDEKGLKDSEVYKKANIDRRLFSKIRSDVSYKPKKQTAVAFVLALEMNPDEAEKLLAKAGYVLSDSILFDVIIRHYIEIGNYDIYEINSVLFSYDQSLIGA